MYKLFGNLKDWVKFQDTNTDGAIFRLHNIFTAVLLLTCSLIITGTQYVGKPIECLVNGLPTHPINTYCWITSTFTMPDAFQRQVGKDVAHPGVANDFGDEDAKKYHTYYQWVCFVLFFQVSQIFSFSIFGCRLLFRFGRMRCSTRRPFWRAASSKRRDTFSGLTVAISTTHVPTSSPMLTPLWYFCWRRNPSCNSQGERSRSRERHRVRNHASYTLYLVCCHYGIWVEQSRLKI